MSPTKYIIKNTWKFSTQHNLDNSWEVIHKIWGYLGEVSAGLLVTEKRKHISTSNIPLELVQCILGVLQPQLPFYQMGIVETSNPSPFPRITKQLHFAFRDAETRFWGGIFVLNKHKSTAMCVPVPTNMTKCRFSWERDSQEKIRIL